MTYGETIKLYENGLISYSEVREQISYLNMGSDTTTYTMPAYRGW